MCCVSDFLRFDNVYSWVHSKTVHHSITLVDTQVANDELDEKALTPLDDIVKKEEEAESAAENKMAAKVEPETAQASNAASDTSKANDVIPESKDEAQNCVANDDNANEKTESEGKEEENKSDGKKDATEANENGLIARDAK